ncbi:MAG: chromosome segregation protein SMC [Nitrospirota bacterium]
MRLTQITLHGFKSFADRTTIAVPEGIVAIVGPNGCGKSNISDAILWAIGEQSAKTLRADKMEDVLFNGSERRKPMGMAEVSLTFSGLQGELTSRFGEFGELTVTRRLFRSGESEYLINKVACRLKDIRDLLLEAGGSFKGHTIIEQGKVDGLITASPIERRGLIEEAAGIAKYKLRKAEAARKLEATEQNLLRVKDIIGEVRRQINALDRQAKKAQAAQQLAAQLRGLELGLGAHRLRSLRAQAGEQARLQGEAQQAEASQSAAVGALEAEIERLRLAELEAHQAIRSLEQELFSRETEEHRAAERLVHLREQQTVWGTEAESRRDEQSRLDAALAEQQAQILRQQAELAELKRDMDGRDAALQAQQQQAGALEQACDAERLAHEELNRQLFAAMTVVSDAQNRLTLLQARLASLERERERLSAERRRVDGEQAQAAEQRADAAGRRQEATRRLAEQQAAHLELAIDIERRRQALAAAEQARGQAQTALTEATIRLASVQELETTLRRQQTELRDTLTTQGPVAAAELHGLVADLIEVPAPYERAIEAALGERLQAFVIDGAQSAQSAIAFLKQQTAGRALFLPMRWQDDRQPAPAFSDVRLIGPAATLVSPRPGAPPAQPLIDRLLGRVWVIDTLEQALPLAPALPPGGLLVTVDGDLVSSDGLISGGHPPEAGSGHGHGLLQQRRTRQAIETALPGLEARVEELTRQCGEAQKGLDGALGMEQRARDEMQQWQMALVNQQRELDQLEQGRERLEAQQALLQQESDIVLRETEAAERERRQVDEELARLARRRQVLEAQLVDRTAAVATAARQREAAQEQLTQLKVALASGQERVEQAASAAAHLERLAEHLRQQREEKAARLAWLAEQHTRARQEEDRLLVQQRETAAALQSIRARHREALAAGEQRQATLRMKQAEEKTQRQALEQRQAEAAERGRLLSEVSHQIDRIADYLATVYQVSPDAALADAPPLPEAGEADAEQQIAALKAKREQMGPVNPAAIEEYEELRQRYDFLTKQEADLTQSIEDLRAAIGKINRTTKTLFLDTFAQLNQKFGELYGQFFEGGQASLTLLDEENPLESGIEIMAQPPGKRLRTIQLLSGGEKALTAIALLMASFLIAPSPFCLLDEIDAPLDEENIRRFTTVLRRMVGQTQFLVVTHNKRTMEIADQLYGVTMEEPGISKIIGVRLEAAERLAVSV